MGFGSVQTSVFFFSGILSLQDKAQPETQARSFGDVHFNAFLAVDDPGALPLVRQPGADGFRMDSTALFQVSKKVKYGKCIQCIHSDYSLILIKSCGLFWIFY